MTETDIGLRFYMISDLFLHDIGLRYKGLTKNSWWCKRRKDNAKKLLFLLLVLFVCIWVTLERLI